MSSGARFFKPTNRLADSVDVRFGLSAETAVDRGAQVVLSSGDDMRKSVKGWVGEIIRLSEQPQPDIARLSWLANGVLGVGGAAGMTRLARCGGLFAHALDLIGDKWRPELGALYGNAIGRLLEDTDASAEQDRMLSSLEDMNKRLAGEVPVAS
ncbi:MAG TPA: hypothetical protein PLF78_03720 [Caulobacter sp.]|nr:hypothetical protein [Caulobacter sp.]